MFMTYENLAKSLVSVLNFDEFTVDPLVNGDNYHTLIFITANIIYRSCSVCGYYRKYVIGELFENHAIHFITFRMVDYGCRLESRETNICSGGA